MLKLFRIFHMIAGSTPATVALAKVGLVQI
jgi:hypothetical protein